MMSVRHNGWYTMDTAPKDRLILVARINDVRWEYDLVWWNKHNSIYPWSSRHTSYPEGRLDYWKELDEPYKVEELESK